MIIFDARIGRPGGRQAMTLKWPAAGFLKRLKDEHARAHEAERLLELDDQTLADLGLKRADIVHYICEGGSLSAEPESASPPHRSRTH
jgi:hypothetical protein